MKVIILAGGYGTRISEHTDSIPKPLIKVGGMPIIEHIMDIYNYYDYSEFIVALGYKGESIKDYFLNYQTINSDFTVNLKNGNINIEKCFSKDYKITLVDTGLNTLTGNRIKKLKEYVGNNTFMLTYGDGLSNIDIKELVNFHHTQKKILTISVVRPTVRFGELILEGDLVKVFQEKKQLHEGWINAGFMVCEPEIFNYINDSPVMFERDPIELLTKKNEVAAFKHEGFWQCIDTKRELDSMNESLLKSTPWKTKK